MKKEYSNLFKFMERFVQSKGAPRSYPKPETLPTPWETSTLIAFTRYRDRQRWARGIVEERLDPAREGGVVPGMPEWEYRFHGNGCSVKNKVTGETIEADCRGMIDGKVWQQQLESINDPDPATRLMLDMHPSGKSLLFSLSELHCARILEVDTMGAYRFVPSYSVPIATIEQVSKLMADGANLPPVYIEVGELDIFRNECMAFARRTGLAGVSTELHVHAGVPHGWDVVAPEADVTKRAMEDRIRRLQSV